MPTNLQTSEGKSVLIEHNTTSTNGSSIHNNANNSELLSIIKPKLIIVIRNGTKPRKFIRMLLNKKTVHSFDQVLNNITQAIKLHSGPVKKLFSLSGKRVTSLQDYFGEDHIFIAYGPERHHLDDFNLDLEECKSLNVKRLPIGQNSAPTSVRKTIETAMTKNLSINDIRNDNRRTPANDYHSTNAKTPAHHHHHNRSNGSNNVAQRLQFGQHTTPQSKNSRTPKNLISSQSGGSTAKLSQSTCTVNKTGVSNNHLNVDSHSVAKCTPGKYINGTLPPSSARRTPLSSASSTTSSVGRLSGSVSSGSVQTIGSSLPRSYKPHANNSHKEQSRNSARITPARQRQRPNPAPTTPTPVSQLDQLYENVVELRKSLHRNSISGGESIANSTIGVLSSSVQSNGANGLGEIVSCTSLQRLVERTESDLDSEQEEQLHRVKHAGRQHSGTVFDVGLDGLREAAAVLRVSSTGNLANQVPNSCSLKFPLRVLQNYEIGPVIGDGNFAVVHQCGHRRSKRKFALKIIDKGKCVGKEEMIENEVAILKKVKHPNIVELYEEFNYSNELYLVMELVSGGDLFDGIAQVSNYTEHEAQFLVRDLSAAIYYLHSQRICHRDIKPENLLLTSCDLLSNCANLIRLKLGDFGLAVEMRSGEKLFTVCGTPCYVAPEILSEIGYDLKVDIWAAGVIMYILLCGFPPFASETNNQDELFEKILSGKFVFAESFWQGVSIEAKNLICCILRVNSNDRFTAADVINHTWIKNDISTFTYENYVTGDEPDLGHYDPYHYETANSFTDSETRHPYSHRQNQAQNQHVQHIQRKHYQTTNGVHGNFIATSDNSNSSNSFISS